MPARTKQKPDLRPEVATHCARCGLAVVGPAGSVGRCEGGHAVPLLSAGKKLKAPPAPKSKLSYAERKLRLEGHEMLYFHPFSPGCCDSARRQLELFPELLP